MTKFPTEVDPPETLIPNLIILRDAALREYHFDCGVHLSHCIAWMNWLKNNYKELNDATTDE